SIFPSHVLTCRSRRILSPSPSCSALCDCASRRRIPPLARPASCATAASPAAGRTSRRHGPRLPPPPHLVPPARPVPPAPPPHLPPPAARRTSCATSARRTPAALPGS